MKWKQEAVCLCLACLLTCTGAEKPEVRRLPAEAAYRDSETGLTFNARLGAFRKVMVRRNTNPAAGTVIRYESETGACADIYVYTLNGAGRAVSGEELRVHFKDTREAIRNMPQQTALVRKAEELPHSEPGIPGWMTAVFRIEIKEDAVVSHLLMRLYRGMVVKLRISFPENDPDETRAALEFEKEAGGLLDSAR